MNLSPFTCQNILSVFAAYLLFGDMLDLCGPHHTTVSAKGFDKHSSLCKLKETLILRGGSLT